MVDSPSEPPRSVAGLATDPAWRITTGAAGGWLLAERLLEQDGQRWRIGLSLALSVILISRCLT